MLTSSRHGSKEKLVHSTRSPVERSTGLRVEWTSFSFDPWRLEVSIRGLTLHGREGEQSPPLFAADQVETQWNLISIWNLSADLARLRVLNPRIYVAISEDGESNLPVPSAAASGNGAGGLAAGGAGFSAKCARQLVSRGFSGMFRPPPPASWTGSGPGPSRWCSPRIRESTRP